MTENTYDTGIKIPVKMTFFLTKILGHNFLDLAKKYNLCYKATFNVYFNHVRHTCALIKLWVFSCILIQKAMLEAICICHKGDVRSVVLELPVPNGGSQSVKNVDLSTYTCIKVSKTITIL